MFRPFVPSLQHLVEARRIVTGWLANAAQGQLAFTSKGVFERSNIINAVNYSIKERLYNNLEGAKGVFLKMLEAHD